MIGTDEPGRVFIAMELVEGTTLRERLADKGAFSVADALERASRGGAAEGPRLRVTR